MFTRMGARLASRLLLASLSLISSQEIPATWMKLTAKIITDPISKIAKTKIYKEKSMNISKNTASKKRTCKVSNVKFSRTLRTVQAPSTLYKTQVQSDKLTRTWESNKSI